MVSVESVCVHSFISSRASGQMMSWSNVFVIRGDRTLEMEDGYFFELGIANHLTLALHNWMAQFSIALS